MVHQQQRDEALAICEQMEASIRELEAIFKEMGEGVREWRESLAANAPKGGEPWVE